MGTSTACAIPGSVFDDPTQLLTNEEVLAEMYRVME